MRNLILFLLLLIVVYFVRRALTSGGSSAPGDAAPSAPDGGGEAETMQACAHCGVLVPRSEGVEQGGAFYCSPGHARSGPSAG